MGVVGMLPKRLLRYLLYLLTALVLSSFVLLFAHKHELIVLDNYLPTHLTPSFFQPPSELYIVDVSINNCAKWNRKSNTCGLPGGKYGRYGDLKSAGGWIKVPKDLTLGKKLFSREYLSYKQVQRKYFTQGPAEDDVDQDEKEEDLEEHEYEMVIVDLAVGDPIKDALIKGNEKTKYPRYVLEDFASSRTFTDEDYKEMLENGEIPSGDALTWDKSKSTSNQVSGEEINRIENEAVRKMDEDKKKQSEFNSETPEEQLSDALIQDESKNSKEEETEKNKSNGAQLNQLEIEAEEKAEMKKQKEDSESDAEKLNEALSEEEQENRKKNKNRKNKQTNSNNARPSEKEEQKKAKEEMDKLMNENEKEKESDKRTKRDLGRLIEKRKLENDRHALNGYHHIPTKEEITKKGWVAKSNGVWAKYGRYKTKYPVTAIDLLFGHDAVEPRPNWKLIKTPLQGFNSKKYPAFITFRKGPKMDYKKNYRKSLNFNSNGKFKILQVADLHFSTGYGKCRDSSPSNTKKGCLADPRTLQFLESALEIEKPDFIVLTGDQIFGEASPDAESAVFKALHPFIKRGIPFAVTMGNHDDEGSLSRSEIMGVSSSLPYSLAQEGAEDIAGIGNYVLNVRGKHSQPSMSLVFLDSHKYSPNPKAQPGYDWIKESQLKWLEDQFKSKASRQGLSMAFFHIPLPEYRNLNQPFIGENREGVTAPTYNLGARSLFGNLGISVVSVGHDHCNDYCLLDTFKGDFLENKVWLCYGGGSGEGGYGGYGGYIRKLRVYEVDNNKQEIKSWKRSEDDPKKDFDHQILVSEGQVVNM